MIWDTFIFRDELDVLEMRLEQLSMVVDRFVLVEAPFTHGTREPKPLVFAEHGHSWRFAPWAGRIEHIVMRPGDMPEGPDPWTREHAQREACAIALRDARPLDLVLHGDVDEIPDPGAVAIAGRGGGPSVMRQRMTHFAVDWLDPAEWNGTIAARWQDVEGFQWLRARRNELPAVPHPGGWHFSSLGPVAHQAYKVRAGCHMQDAVSEGAWEGISSGRYYREGWHQGTTKLIPVDVDNSWPRYIHERRCPPSWFRPREQS